MDCIIGTDEAGYGPNYGPLVIAATRWEVADANNIDLRTALESIVCEQPTEADSRIAICDSKALYSAGKSIGTLELGVLAFFSQVARIPDDFFQLFCKLAPSVEGNDAVTAMTDEVSRLFAISGDPCPGSCEATLLDEHVARLRQALDDSGIRFGGMQVRCVFPSCFNELLRVHSNKATLLSHETLMLVRRMLPEEGDVRILCDKHGGRSKYAGLIQHCLTRDPVRVGKESLAHSNYRWQSHHRNFSAEFSARGESQVPVALASMTAKYVRERFMSAWNRFWLSEIPDLKPTAGYPADARRFRAAIAEKQRELGIEHETVWRAR